MKLKCAINVSERAFNVNRNSFFGTKIYIKMFINILVSGDLVGTNAIKNAVFCYNICTNNYVFFIIFNKNFTKIHKKMFVQK